ncbi:MAG: xanthine dehydrogenase accessory factor [Solirubrobacteraceae bacterium]|nr:xanthine dehydrogenase accessory factor [Solirubrobacteraceae bacterium]
MQPRARVGRDERKRAARAVRDDALARRAEELAAQGAAFVTATVVRAQRPTSARAGNVALVLSDGSIDGFVGGVCAEHSVRLYALKSMKSGEPLLLRILPTVDDEVVGDQEVKEDGAVTVQNTCLSGGAIEVFLEPVLPAPRVHIVGATPIAAALERAGPELGLDIVAAQDAPPTLREGDLAIVVAAHGKGELEALRAGLESELPYVGLVASPRRGAGLVEELRADGVSDEHLQRLECPAGLAIDARTPPEIALSILARIIQTRRSGDYSPPLSGPASEAPPTFAVDPICGMTVTAASATLHVEHDGETVYFCCDGCKAKFLDSIAAGAAVEAVKAPKRSSTAEAAPAAVEMVVDPICGMTVVALPDTPHVEHDGETVYFCCDGCKKKFQQEHVDAVTAG